MNGDNVTYFDSFGVEYFSEEITEFIDNKNIRANIYRIRAYHSMMCGHFCVGFIDFMLKGKRLSEYTNLLSPNKYAKNDRIIFKYFQYNLKRLQ